MHAPGPRHRRGPGRVGPHADGPQRPPLLSLAFLIVWWFVLGPVGLGGPATFAIVDGRSMEPTYLEGDLVIARTRVTYEVGDVVVFTASDRRRYVIHRIVGGDALGGWTTRGDNNASDDLWSLPDDAILGREWLVLPRVGATVAWTKERPLLFAAVVGVAVALSVASERRRRPPHPVLADALGTARRVPGRIGRPNGVLVVVLAAATAGVTSVASLGWLAVLGLLPTAVGPVALLLAVLVGSLVVGIPALRRLADGYGLPEPTASRRALAGLCWEVDVLPDLARCVDHRDVRSLRAVALRASGRVLRRTELGADGRERDTFLTVDDDGVGHRWVVAGEAPPTGPDVAPVPLPAPAPLPAPVRIVVPPPPVVTRVVVDRIPAMSSDAPGFDAIEARLDAVRRSFERRLADLQVGIAPGLGT